MFTEYSLYISDNMDVMKCVVCGERSTEMNYFLGHLYIVTDIHSIPCESWYHIWKANRNVIML